MTLFLNTLFSDRSKKETKKTPSESKTKLDGKYNEKFELSETGLAVRLD